MRKRKAKKIVATLWRSIADHMLKDKEALALLRKSSYGEKTHTALKIIYGKKTGTDG